MTDHLTRLDGLRIRMLDGLDLIVLRDADGDLELIQEGGTVYLSASAVELVMRALQQLTEPRERPAVIRLATDRAPASDLIAQVEAGFPGDAA